MSTLVPSGQADGGSEDRAGRLTELETMLRERVAEIGRVKSDLAAFKLRYQEQVGWLHEELDELERAIAEAELGQISKRLEDEGRHRRAARADRGAEPAPRYASDAVRKLFRDVAKAIHPDLAGDESTRKRRHALMIEANRAYASGDEERLRWILRSWETSPEAVPGSDDQATQLRIVRRIAQLEEELAVFTADLDSLKDSPMWKLKSMVDEAATQGKDLIREMVGRLKVDIMVARNRLEAIAWAPDASARGE